MLDDIGGLPLAQLLDELTSRIESDTTVTVFLTAVDDGFAGVPSPDGNKCVGER